VLTVRTQATPHQPGFIGLHGRGPVARGARHVNHRVVRGSRHPMQSHECMRRCAVQNWTGRPAHETIEPCRLPEHARPRTSCRPAVSASDVQALAHADNRDHGGGSPEIIGDAPDERLLLRTSCSSRSSLVRTHRRTPRTAAVCSLIAELNPRSRPVAATPRPRPAILRPVRLWQSRFDGDRGIAFVSHKAEHAADLEKGAIVAVT
jgi:hypothetical protein